MGLADSLQEIKAILDKLSAKEKKAIVKYFKWFYAETKELRLLELLISITPTDTDLLEHLVESDGKNGKSAQLKSFYKLRSRLRQKIIDFLITDFSSPPGRLTDAFTVTKKHLKKTIFQAQILFEKAFFTQAKDLYIHAERLAVEHQHYAEAVNALTEYQFVADHNGNKLEQQRLTSKINRYRLLHLLTDTYYTRLRDAVDHVNMCMFDHPEELLESLLQDMSYQMMTAAELQNIAVRDYVEILILQHKNKAREGFKMSIKWMEALSERPATYHPDLKILIKLSFFENLLLLGKFDLYYFFLHQSGPNHVPDSDQFHLSKIQMQGKIMTKDKPHYEAELSKMYKYAYRPFENRTYNYYLAHHHFYRENPKQALELINLNMPQYKIEDVQKLDLMILELICLCDIGKFDLLEYRMQSYIKNLFYRKKLGVPQYYDLIQHIFHRLVRTNYDFSDDRILNYMIDLKAIEPNGLFRLRSTQPKLTFDWFKSKLSQSELSFITDTSQTHPALKQ